MKNNRNGKAAIISDADYIKIRKSLKSKKYRLLLDVARFTGERWGAILQLLVTDVIDNYGNVRSHITFRATTRKATSRGDRRTRQVSVHPELRESFEANPPRLLQVWMFESPMKPNEPITLRAADLMLRAALKLARLEHKGYSTHSTRRTFITRLWERGVDLHTIQLTTGHQDLKSLVGYVEADPDRVARAIALL
jgi:integrase/recombinase XerD